ncbi:hypothetical protein AB0F88_39575 [Streptosporangium sp. NPDC023963]|uniref:hypothetical protein n=1 Tax=Streptosporangium sp. NPDC023963 TaxID=3155608 RepID=UPI003428BD1C
MFKHVLTIGTLAASGFIVAMTMPVQPAGAKATPQEAAPVSVLPSDPSPGGHRQHRSSPGHYQPRSAPGLRQHRFSPGRRQQQPEAGRRQQQPEADRRQQQPEADRQGGSSPGRQKYSLRGNQYFWPGSPF